MDVKLSSKNQIVVPKNVRQTLKLKSGDRLSLKLVNNKVSITKAPPIEKQLDDIRKMSPSTKTNAVKRVRKLRDEWE